MHESARGQWTFLHGARGMVLALAGILISTTAPALELGEPGSTPVLGQSLYLTIPLQASDAERAALEVRIVEVATPAEWLRDAGALAGRFKAQLVTDSAGRAKILLTSVARLSEPYLDVTLELSAGGESLRRTVTLLPEIVTPARVAAAPAPKLRPVDAPAQARTPPETLEPSPDRGLILEPDRVANGSPASTGAMSISRELALPKNPHANEPVQVDRALLKSPAPAKPALGPIVTLALVVALLTAVLAFGGLALLAPASLPRRKTARAAPAA